MPPRPAQEFFVTSQQEAGVHDSSGDFGRQRDISYLKDTGASDHLVSMQTQSSMKEAVISSNMKC